MEYTLERLLKDKKLRATVAKERFAFEDGNGVVQCLDFENLTYLKNHRALYDFLCQAGGEELLGKLLAQGKTCLTDDPDSANTGVRGIRGTEKYFLKTNAGDSTVLASILWGIQGLSETMDGFDPDKVRIVTADTAEADDEEPEEENTEVLLELDDMSDEEPQEELLPAHTDVSLVQKDGKFSLYDNETKEFITLDCPDAPDGQIASMAVCEKLKIPERREDQFDGMEEGKEINLGWRYKLNEDTDLWGWISADCTRVSAPIFQKVAVRCDDTHYDLEHMNILAWSGRNLYQAGAGQNLRWVLSGMFEPKEEQEISYTQGNNWHLLLRTDENGETGLLSYVSEIPESFSPQWVYEVTFRKGVLWLHKSHSRERTLCLCESVSLNRCLSCFTEESTWSLRTPVFKPTEYTDAVQLHDAGFEFSSLDKGGKYYAVRGRDGYWGVIHTWKWRSTHEDERCTPSAFTSVRVLDEDAGLALVERFGRWGVYDCLNDCYPVPCEYDRVTLCRNVFTGHREGFEVHRMDFVGQIRMNGEWETPLRRTEE